MENFRIVGGGRFNVKKFLNKNNDMRKKYCKIISLFLLFTASHDRQINGNWRRESKRRQQYRLLSSFLLLPAPNPPSSIPYITFTQMIFAQDYKRTQESRQQKQP